MLKMIKQLFLMLIILLNSWLIYAVQNDNIIPVLSVIFEKTKPKVTIFNITEEEFISLNQSYDNWINLIYKIKSQLGDKVKIIIPITFIGDEFEKLTSLEGVFVEGVRGEKEVFEVGRTVKFLSYQRYHYDITASAVLKNAIREPYKRDPFLINKNIVEQLPRVTSDELSVSDVEFVVINPLTPEYFSYSGMSYSELLGSALLLKQHYSSATNVMIDFVITTISFLVIVLSLYSLIGKMIVSKFKAVRPIQP